MTLFFYGPNTYALRRQVSQMVQAYLAKAGSDFGLERLDGAMVKQRELQAALQAAPFLASSRLVIIEGLATNKALADKVPVLMAGVPSTTVAVFVEREVDARTTVFKTLSKADKVIKFEPLIGPKLAAWVTAEVQRLGGEISAPVVRELIEMVGEDQWRLSGELGKLVNYQSSITTQAVHALVAPSLERSIFDLVEAMTAGRAASAMVSYRALLDQKESEMYVLTMIQWQLRNLLLAKTAPVSMSPSDLAKAAGMSPYVAGKMAVAQSGVSEAVLVSAYGAAADCEYDIKTGRYGSELAVERLIYQVVTSVKEAAATI